jgi:integrase/recombinase XerD
VSALAPVLEAFFTERLIRQRRASDHTIASYRDAFRLLLGFAHTRTGKQPCQLDFVDLDAQLIGAFLEHLEHERHNSVRSRNARLTAIRSFYRFAAYREPGHAALIAQVLAIPEKRATRRIVSFLVGAEIDALLAAPDRSTWIGRRDHALLALTLQAGLPVS